VVLIEGGTANSRMFQACFFVFLVGENQARALGPLVLDVAPGKFRALTVREWRS